ncbi:hypothetical protein [Mesorhizobium japonicum]|uniref:Msl9688 protein n=1 Tax=Mesorhizobium japonicum (strain LMG 29417 / CECT 9101 / MAFF 303099) TaxID=266835 RepID=Q98NY3_RHILO|nr:hypothetical protein [Mesorhizobium japonicum]BAB54872.1 msl9688 [Mesorhizobium japonicum MAFF 303099]
MSDAHLILKTVSAKRYKIDVSPLLSMELAMDSLTPGSKVNPCVEVLEACGEWFVRVVDGDEELTRTFVLESFALAYAEGQRRRLGLADFDRR